MKTAPDDGISLRGHNAHLPTGRMYSTTKQFEERFMVGSMGPHDGNHPSLLDPHVDNAWGSHIL